MRCVSIKKFLASGKMLSRIGVLLILIALASCEPLYYNDGVSPDMETAEFCFSVTPDSLALHVGDTVTVEAAIDNNFGNGIITNDGTAYLPFSFSGATHIPKVDFNDYYDCEDGSDFDLIVDAGSVEYKLGGASRSIYQLKTKMESDSFKMK